MIHIVYISDYIYILYKNSFYSHNNHRSLLLLLCVLYVRENQGTEGSSNLLIVTQLWSCRPGIPNPRICIPEPRFWSRMLHPSLNKATYSIQKKNKSFMAEKRKVCRIQGRCLWQASHFFQYVCLCSNTPSFTQWNVCSVGSRHSYINTYWFGGGCSRTEGQSNCGVRLPWPCSRSRYRIWSVRP